MTRLRIVPMLAFAAMALVSSLAFAEANRRAPTEGRVGVLVASRAKDAEKSRPTHIAWAGDWGSAFSRDCQHRAGLPEPARLDGYARSRPCLFVDADVYAPGLTERTDDPGALVAQVEYRIGRGVISRVALAYVGRVGSNYRYRWALPREALMRAPWNTVTYYFRFSLDGRTWFRIGQGPGPDGGHPRSVVREGTWCVVGQPCR